MQTNQEIYSRVISATVTPEIFNRVKEIARGQDRSISYIARKLIEKALRADDSEPSKHDNSAKGDSV